MKKDNIKYEPVKILLTEGDILTSKKGILTKSSLTDAFYFVYKTEYMGNNRWKIIKKSDAEVSKNGNP